LSSIENNIITKLAALNFLYSFAPEFTNMRTKVIKRLFIIFLTTLVCAVLISYKQAKSSSSQECTGNEKCEQTKAQTDLILLESLSKHLLSATDN